MDPMALIRARAQASRNADFLGTAIGAFRRYRHRRNLRGDDRH